MNLKQAFTYQASLSRSFNETLSMLRHDVNNTRQETTDYEPDREPLTTVRPMNTYNGCDAGQLLMEFAWTLLREKTNLINAIGKTKTKLRNEGTDIDGIVEINRGYNAMAEVIDDDLITTKPYDEKITKKNCQRFNNEGNPITIQYDAKVVTIPSVDTAMARRMLKDLRSKVELTSAKRDYALVKAPVDFEPMFDSFDSSEVMFAKWLDKKKNGEIHELLNEL